MRYQASPLHGASRKSPTKVEACLISERRNWGPLQRLAHRQSSQGVSAMDKDRIAGSAKDFAGKVEGAVGSMAGDPKTKASGFAREAEGTVQNVYGQAKDAARDATDAAVSYAKDAYDNSGDTFRDGSQAIAKKDQENPPKRG